MKRWIRTSVMALMMTSMAAAANAAAPPTAAAPPRTPARATATRATATHAAVPDPLTVLEKTQSVLERLAIRVNPAVVNVRRFVRDEKWWARQQGEKPASGWQVAPARDLVHLMHRPLPGASGFLLSADGYILTLRRNVVDPKTGEAAAFVDVEVQNQALAAQVVSLEPTLDIAILKVQWVDPLPFLHLGDSGKSPAGHWAIAFGDPDGAERTLMPGFVAVSPARECYQDDMSATYMQTSVIVPDGALGGPLVNLRGEVIGVNARRAVSGADSLAPAGSGFALPSNIANAIFQAMLMRESKESPWLGISVLAPNDTLRKKLGPFTGIYIDNVFDPSPASKLGIRIGDVLRAMDDKPIATVHDFQRILYELGAGSRVKLGIVREKKRVELIATIERRPPEALTH